MSCMIARFGFGGALTPPGSSGSGQHARRPREAGLRPATHARTCSLPEAGWPRSLAEIRPATSTYAGSSQATAARRRGHRTCAIAHKHETAFASYCMTCKHHGCRRSSSRSPTWRLELCPFPCVPLATRLHDRRSANRRRQASGSSLRATETVRPKVRGLLVLVRARALAFNGQQTLDAFGVGLCI